MITAKRSDSETWYIYKDDVLVGWLSPQTDSAAWVFVPDEDTRFTLADLRFIAHKIDALNKGLS